MTVTAVAGSSGAAGLPGVPQGTGAEDGQRALDVLFAMRATVASFPSCRFGTELLAGLVSSSGRGQLGQPCAVSVGTVWGVAVPSRKPLRVDRVVVPLSSVPPRFLPCASGACAGDSHQWCCAGPVRLVFGLRLLSLSVTLCHLRPVKFTAVPWPCLPMRHVFKLPEVKS